MRVILRRNLRLIVVIVAFAVFCLLVHRFAFHLVRIEGSSMVETLRSGDIVWVSSVERLLGIDPNRGDIVECTFPNRDGAYIKRVIGLPGETVEITRSGVFIDGQRLSESYAGPSPEDYRAVLGEDEYLVLGDNRAESYDSRMPEIGFLHRENFTGRVCFALWPFRRIK